MKHVAWTKRKSALTLTLCAIIATSTIIILQNTQTTQAALIDPHPGLVGWWRFDDGSGTVAGDSSGNGNNGTIHSQTWVTGKYGQALSFDGSSSYVNVPNSASLGVTSAATIEFWFMPKELNRLQHLLAKNGAYDIFLQSNNMIYARRTSTPFEIVASNPLTANDLNKWMFVVCVYDHRSANKINLYINGVLLNQVTLLNDISQTTSDLSIGSWGGTGDFTDGIFDEVRIYGRALSATEIQTDFQQNPDFSSYVLARVPMGTTQVITTLSWQGTGSINVTITSPSQTYTESMMPEYQKTTYSTSSGISSMLNIKRLQVSVNALPSDQNWNITLTCDNPVAYQIAVEVQK